MKILFCLLLLTSLLQTNNAQSQKAFVKVQNAQLRINDQPYYFIGANYWYAGLLANSGQGKLRITRELDFLENKGVTNLRILVGAEGVGLVNGVTRVSPAYQPQPGVFNDSLLLGLDYLLVEMGKRNMKAVLYLSNNWEWSGGFLQYLNWNGMLPDSTMRRKLSWDEMRDIVSRFYACEPCVAQYLAQVAHVVGRQNSITKKPYAEDAAIMSWELANEPRPMRPTAIEEYLSWISSAAKTIKSIDANHLVTAGVEGYMGTESLEVFKQVHNISYIDYATIHIWPKNWSWFSDTAISAGMNNVISNTSNYIASHLEIMQQLQKPLVLEEFGLPRDRHSFDPKQPVTLRDAYFNNIFAQWQKQVGTGAWAGCNFWAFGGIGRASDVWWTQGADWLGDPPQEEQGLNNVFDSDSSTWRVIERYTSTLKK